jgi:hypothetical protein
VKYWVRPSPLSQVIEHLTRLSSETIPPPTLT